MAICTYPLQLGQSHTTLSLGEPLSLLLDRIPALFSRKRKGKKDLRRGRGLRPDVQGLRAFAVLAVILDHTFGWPRGGFVGVDIFFVISGFVITASLLREHDRTGRISFAGFYKRRVKRILPAAVLVLLVTSAAGFFVFNQARASSTVWDAVWAFFFSANWRQAVIGTDYFQASGPVPPLQHYWSLSVEEQFYFVWPWLMVLLFALAARALRGRGQERVVAGVAMSFIVAASFAWSVWETATNPTVAYFSTFSRAWELGVGGILACIATVLTRIPQGARPALGGAGMAGMVAALFVTDAHAGFPGPGAALSVLSAAVFIAAGTGSSSHRYMTPLTNRVAVYLGDISYSLYLWHFPVIVFGAAIVSETSAGYFTVVLAAIFVISIYSYHLLEDPIRKSDWLAGNTRGSKERPSFSTGFKLTALSLLSMVTVAVTAFAILSTAPTSAPIISASTARPSTAAAVPAAYGPASAQIKTQIATALASPDWPDLTPSMDSVIGGSQVPDDVSRCGNVGPIRDGCTWGDPSAPKTAVIIGDSVALTYVTALRDVLADKPDWKLSTYAAFGCSFTDTRISNADANIVLGCPGRKDEAVAAINKLHPDIVFITNTYEPRLDLTTKVPLTPAQWNASTSKFVDLFKASTKKIVFVAPPPSDKDVKACYSRTSKPVACVGQVTPQWYAIANAEQDIAKKIGGTWLDTSRLFCDARDACPSFVGTTPTKSDKVHMTAEYAHKIAPALLEQLNSLKLL
ncbi:acyltransferase family protein [Pseudarthrobacter sp. BRE9]|uniref:acyltransferase family protein n=1 Tax=Pseudarthrobacter sp. BRE9 TaxID=2962582 RepID=UPI002881D42D|nr:acyltransferase family protein [Pseudarthrobacter sp. BRE9]MDT0168115.1 acyltransferase family protein [Pseudarthrobacter sp. BRE9]